MAGLQRGASRILERARARGVLPCQARGPGRRSAVRWALPLLLLAGGVAAQPAGVGEALGPRGPDAAPALDVPLATEPPPALDTLDVAAKRDRLPDETLVEIKHIAVTRLLPRDQAAGACQEVIYADLCGQPLDDPGLDRLLAELLQQIDHRASVFDLEDIALRVTQYLRGGQRLLDTAFVPPQTVAGGVVNLYVLTGQLGKVNVSGNKRYKPKVLAWPFAPMIGDPVVRRDVIHSVLNIWEYPGLLFAPRKASVTFVPGASTGETDINLEVYEDPLPINMVLSTDNAGSQYSGEYRARTDIAWNNPTGGADRLAGSVTYAFDPAGNTYYSLDYMRPVFTPDWRAGLGISTNAYDLGGDIEDLGITGEVEQAFVWLNHLFYQSFTDRLAMEIRFSRKDATTFQKDKRISKDQLAPLDISLDWVTTDTLLAPEKRANQTRVLFAYTHGFGDLLGSMAGTDAEAASRIAANGEHAGAEYDKLVAGVIRKQAMPWNTDLWLRLNGQYTQNFLVPLEQFAIGGPNSVRAYPVAEWLFDQGYFASLEWEFGVPWLGKLQEKLPNCLYLPKWSACGVNPRPRLNDALKLGLFVDFAEGWLNDARKGETEHQAVTGVGAGLKFESRNLRMNFSIATPVGSPEPSNSYDPQFFFSLAYQPF